MRTFLRDVTIKGVKNLNKPIELVFSKKDINSFEELKDNNIKAIYGPNGSGKTTIVHAFTILSGILKKPNYIQDFRTVKYLNTLLNKECECIELSLNFFFECVN